MIGLPKKSVAICIAVLVLACAAQCAVRRKRDDEKNGYIFTAPKSLKTGGVENELQLQRLGQLDAGVLKVQVFYQENYNSNESLALEKEFEIPQGEKTSTMTLVVDPFENYVYNGRLQMNGSFGTYKIGGTDKVSFSSSSPNIVLIQTDKPLYQPGQDVKFRVLKVNKKLVPSGRKDDIAEVTIEDPKGTKLFLFNDIDLGKGINQREFSLSNEPALGTWKINVKSKNFTDSGTFDVKEYVLPKFETKITFPSFVLANAEEIPISVCAKYTYGKNVIGTLNLNVSLESYSWSREKNPVLQETVKLDGCFNYTINVSLIEANQYRYRRIMVVSNIIEEGTGVERNETQYVQRQYSPLNLNFNSDQRQYFKPGLPYEGKLQVNNPDDTPAKGEKIELCSTIERQRVIFQWWATRKFRVCKNYTSDDKGVIKYTILPQNVDTVSIYLEAKSIKYAKDPSKTGERDNLLNQPTTSMSASPYYSPSGSFIQLENNDKPLPCGSEKNIRLLFTSKEDNKFKFYYKVIHQGQVITSGQLDHTFSVDDDVSERLDNGPRVLKGKEVQLVPPPDASAKTPSGDDDCPAAKESKYTPPIGEANIKLAIDSSYSPSVSVLVYYIRDDKETVADSQKINIEKCLKNKVVFKFADREKQPGTKTKISIKAAPNSLCGVKIVDESVSLLDNRDQVTLEKVFHSLQSDNDYYSYSNPCGESVPQPGLYKSSIIRPPGPVPPSSSSSYSDSLAAFQDVGYVVMSDLTIFSRPCSSRNGGYNGYQTDYSSYGGPGGGSGSYESAAYEADESLSLPNSGEAQRSGVISPTKSAVAVRDYFPETWLFDLELVGPNGEHESKETLPHTITSWDGSAVCVSEKEGLGISNTDSIRGLQAFFLSTTLPTSVVRGEQFWIVVSVFSYAEAPLPITVKLDSPDGFAVTSDSVGGDVCVEPGTSQSMRIKLKGTHVGKQNITIRAETAASPAVCGDERVSSQKAKDAITNSLEVKAEGFPAEQVNSVLFCPGDEENKVYSNSFSFELPDDVIPDSARALVDVTGNVMGPALQNIDSLVQLPTGCGEQNMVLFVPNLSVLEYLKDTGELTDAIKRKAINNLQKGYQRELNYRRNDGSFSAFGQVDRSGSTFLTAFVLRSFSQAKQYIAIDDDVLQQAKSFIEAKQQADGCFANAGQIIDHGLQGGIEKEKANGPITAYVLASLIIAGYDNSTVMDAALACMNADDTTASPYQTALYAYTDALLGNNGNSQKRLKSIDAALIKDNGVEYYSNPNGSKALNLETAAYAVLTILRTGGTAKDALPLVRFMTQNLNSNGGFYSTQDTVVGLQALAEFAKIVYREDLQLDVTLSGALDKKLHIGQDNKMLIQRNLISHIPSQLQLQSTGSGCGLVQTSLRYNTKSPPQTLKFYLEVTGTCTSDDCKRAKINVHAIYLPEGKKSGMAVIEVKMISGVSPNRDSLNSLKSGKAQVMRSDVDNNNVILYFSEITNAGKVFSFDVEKVVDVEDVQPAAAKVYDYYTPEDAAITSYLILKRQPGEVSAQPKPEPEPTSSPVIDSSDYFNEPADSNA